MARFIKHIIEKICMNSSAAEVLREIEQGELAKKTIDLYIEMALMGTEIEPSQNFAHCHDVAIKAVEDAVNEGKIYDRYALQRIYAAGFFHNSRFNPEEIGTKLNDKSIADIINKKSKHWEHVAFADAREALKTDRIFSVGLFERKYLWLIPGMRTTMLERGLVHKFNQLPEKRRKQLMPKVEEKIRSQEIQNQKALGRDKQALDQLAKDAVKSRIQRTREKIRYLREIHPDLVEKYGNDFSEDAAILFIKMPDTK